MNKDNDAFLRADRCIGLVRDMLAGVGLFCAVVAACIFAGYLT